MTQKPRKQRSCITHEPKINKALEGKRLSVVSSLLVFSIPVHSLEQHCAGLLHNTKTEVSYVLSD